MSSFTGRILGSFTGRIFDHQGSARGLGWVFFRGVLFHQFFHHGFGLFVRGCAGGVNRVIAHFFAPIRKATGAGGLN
ncbi:MAG TPA: hypothetical protein VHW72_20560, partial [Candidatus Angelobacter sp.]|nr:hypothetical protein [Candidatus Angelobacter sp.]